MLKCLAEHWLESILGVSVMVTVAAAVQGMFEVFLFCSTHTKEEPIQCFLIPENLGLQERGICVCVYS